MVKCQKHTGTQTNTAHIICLPKIFNKFSFQLEPIYKTHFIPPPLFTFYPHGSVNKYLHFVMYTASLRHRFTFAEHIYIFFSTHTHIKSKTNFTNLKQNFLTISARLFAAIGSPRVLCTYCHNALNRQICKISTHKNAKYKTR